MSRTVVATAVALLLGLFTRDAWGYLPMLSRFVIRLATSGPPSRKARAATA
jgi:hypothetical protein